MFTFSSPCFFFSSNIRQTFRLPRVLKPDARIVVQAVLLAKPRPADPLRLLLLLAQVVPRDQLARRLQARRERVWRLVSVVFIWNGSGISRSTTSPLWPDVGVKSCPKSNNSEVFQDYPESYQSFVLLLLEFFSPRIFKNRPIWPHWRRRLI